MNEWICHTTIEASTYFPFSTVSSSNREPHPDLSSYTATTGPPTEPRLQRLHNRVYSLRSNVVYILNSDHSQLLKRPRVYQDGTWASAGDRQVPEQCQSKRSSNGETNIHHSFNSSLLGEKLNRKIEFMKIGNRDMAAMLFCVFMFVRDDPACSWTLVQFCGRKMFKCGFFFEYSIW